MVSFWSRSASASFYDQDGDLALNGDVRGTMFGVDSDRGRMIIGVSLAHSRGLGNYAGVDTGRMTSAVRGLYPWVGFKANERVTVWTVAGASRNRTEARSGSRTAPSAGRPAGTRRNTFRASRCVRPTIGRSKQTWPRRPLARRRGDRRRDEVAPRELHIGPSDDLSSCDPDTGTPGGVPGEPDTAQPMTPRNSEPTFNEALCRVLWRMNPEWPERMAAEQHGALLDAGKPDIIVRNGTTAPVIIESEYQPAATVEQDAKHRLGARLSDSGDRVEHCIALRVPRAVQLVPQARLEDAIRLETLEWCLLSQEDDHSNATTRWPTTGWIQGNVEQLADLIEHASVSERIVAAGLHQLETGIRPRSRSPFATGPRNGRA